MSDQMITDWAPGNPNDGVFEYVEAYDCDGTFIRRYRRTPARHVPPGSWVPTDEPMPLLEEAGA